MVMPAKLVGEGVLDIAVLVRLLLGADIRVGEKFNRGGASGLDARILQYNAAARFEPWIVLRDLDQAPCVVRFVHERMPEPADWMLFRIAVRSVETWVMADREAFAEAHSISLSKLPTTPESIDWPKRLMLQMLSGSRRSEIRRALVRIRPGATLEPGPEYNARLVEFVETKWDPVRAEKISPSLKRARSRIAELARRIEKRWK
jgi:hypothetical protein